MGSGPGVPPGAQLRVGEVFQGLRQQGVGTARVYGGERAGPGPAGGVEVAEDKTGRSGP